jgi:hypothetical protein
MKSDFNKVQLLGRDHTKGMLAFKTGVIIDRKAKERSRNSKVARRRIREQMEN